MRKPLWAACVHIVTDNTVSLLSEKHTHLNITIMNSPVLHGYKGLSERETPQHQTDVCQRFDGAHTRLWGDGAALTGLVRLDELLGLVPHRLAVILELEVAGLLPGRGADLEEVSTSEQELEVSIALHTCESGGAEGKTTTR